MQKQQIPIRFSILTNKLPLKTWLVREISLEYHRERVGLILYTNSYMNARVYMFVLRDIKW